MTIKSDKSKVTLDFECEIDEQKYDIKFHYTDELGQTISILEKEEEYTGYPAQLFTEIVDFLRSQSVLGDGGAVPAVAKTAAPAPAVAPAPATPLPIPTMGVDTSALSTASAPAPVPAPVPTPEGQPQSKMPSGGYNAPTLNVEPVQSFTGETHPPAASPVPVREVVATSGEDANDPAILAEREAAVKKSSTGEKSIKRASEEAEE